MDNIIKLIPTITSIIFFFLGVGLFVIGRRWKNRLMYTLGIGFMAGAGAAVFVESAQLREILTAAASVFAVVIAALSIDEARRLRKESADKESRDRKGRLLNEIIMWLRELENRIFPSTGGIMSREIQEEIEYKEKFGLSLETWLSLMQLDESLTQLDSLKSEIREGEYIQKLASGLNSDLGELIEVTLGQMQERKNLVFSGAQYPRTIRDRNEKEDELLRELIEDDTKSLEGLTLSESGRNSVLLGRNAGAIKKSILNAVDKVVEIKTSLL